MRPKRLALVSKEVVDQAGQHVDEAAVVRSWGLSIHRAASGQRSARLLGNVILLPESSTFVGLVPCLHYVGSNEINSQSRFGTPYSTSINIHFALALEPCKEWHSRMTRLRGAILSARPLL